MNGKIIAICENMIAGFDQHMADTYDVPSALSEIIARCIAAERTADELREQLERVTAQYNTLKEMYRTDHDQSIRQEETIKQLNSEIKYLRSTDNAADLAFERMAPLDWRESEQETPYGQMLDGLGDEVEP